MEKIQVYPKNYFNSFRMWLDIPGYQLQDFLNKRVASLNYDDSITLKRGSKKEKIHIEFIKDGFHCKLALPRLCFPISSDEFQDLQVYQPLKASQFFLEAFKYLPHSLSLWILLLNYLCVYFYFKLQPTLFNNYELKLKEKLDALFFVSTLTFVVPIIVFFIAWILLRYTKDYRVRNGLKGEIFFYASIYLFLATSFIRMIIRSRNDALFDFLYHVL